jgi:hypothetical protein
MKQSCHILGRDVQIRGRFARIACLEGEKYTYPNNPEEFLAKMKEDGIRADIFTFLQKLPDTSRRYHYPMETDNLAVLPVTTFEHWWNDQIRYKVRNHARQAAKRGVVMREVPYGDGLVQGICRIYNETPVRQGKHFLHFGMTVERARKYAGTFLDRSIYIGAFLEDTMIGFLKLSMDESRTVACLIHILSMVQHRDKAPTNALIAEAVRACAEQGVSYLVYENFNYGRKTGDSLAQFKEVNGFSRVDVPRYYVPLTTIGRLALRFGLHHRISDRVPESVAEKFRNLRRSWYSFRFPASTES